MHMKKGLCDDKKYELFRRKRESRWHLFPSHFRRTHDILVDAGWSKKADETQGHQSASSVHLIGKTPVSFDRNPAFRGIPRNDWRPIYRVYMALVTNLFK